MLLKNNSQHIMIRKARREIYKSNIKETKSLFQSGEKISALTMGEFITLPIIVGFCLVFVLTI